MEETAALPRLLALAGVLWLVGLLPVTRYVLAAAPAGVPGTAWARGREALARRLARSVDMGALAALAGGLADLALRARELVAFGLAEDLAGGLTGVLGTTTGQAAALRVVAVTGLWVVLRTAMPAAALPGPREDRGERGLVVVWGLLGLGLLALTALDGHAAAAPDPAAAVALGALHAGAGAAWLTGIGTFGLVLPALLTRQRDRVRVRLLAGALGRFARLALVAVGVAVGTGLLAGRDALGAGPASAYGEVLLAKTWLVACVVALGAVNHLVLVPGLRRRAEARAGGRRAGSGRTGGIDPESGLAYTVGVELLLGLLVLGATALLVALPPPG